MAVPYIMPLGFIDQPNETGATFILTNPEDSLGLVPPHKWAVGTTFEWEFDFPITTNPAYEAKPAPKRKTRTSANPKAVSSRDRKTPKPATIQTASRKHPKPKPR